jgi:hypothetical protein
MVAAYTVRVLYGAMSIREPPRDIERVKKMRLCDSWC